MRTGPLGLTRYQWLVLLAAWLVDGKRPPDWP